ncbi:MAG TPA: hypothetical protein PLX97_05020 [Gemmatales bacterium]|nr:hypothetical protein [Gemmatales bacterium]
MYSPALYALLHRVIDYAGTFPPAGLPCAVSWENYLRYQQSPHQWMLRWLVVSAADVDQIPASLDGKLSVLSEVDVSRAVCLETRSMMKASKPVYVEVPVAELPAVKATGCLAKIRTGSIKPEGIPSVDDVERFIVACADLKLPFKATAGLHHPIRAEYPLTYEANAPRAVMHGFLNVFLAATFAWQGRRDIRPVLAETDATAFRFDDKAHWRDWTLTVHEIEQARSQFIHAFGSCSFDEPVQELQARGWL